MQTVCHSAGECSRPLALAFANGLTRWSCDSSSAPVAGGRCSVSPCFHPASEQMLPYALVMSHRVAAAWMVYTVTDRPVAYSTASAYHQNTQNSIALSSQTRTSAFRVTAPGMQLSHSTMENLGTQRDRSMRCCVHRAHHDSPMNRIGKVINSRKT